MSDSEPADVPSEAAISRALRNAVIAIHKSGATENLTVKRVRTRAETELGLPAGFLKNQAWKQKSNDIIHDAVDKYCGDEPAPEPAPALALKSKALAAPKAPKPKPAPQKQKTANTSSPGLKRKAPAPAKKPQKRRKTVASSDEDVEPAPTDSLDKPDALSDAESEPPKKAVRRQKKVVTEDSDADTDGDHRPAQPVNLAVREQERTPLPAVKGDESDSSLSSVIDESPAKKKRQKISPTTKRATKLKARTTKPKEEDNPDAAEIKRLQGWLVKCGIRKVWGKELAKCDTAKDKIRHLKGMLRDAGMKGKFSNEKAARIKERREFAKDLEEIQAGELAWGKAEDNGGSRPRRRLTRPVPRATVPDGDDSEQDNDDQKDDDSSVKNQGDDAETGSEEDEDGGDDSD